jgi:hypothetical protein
MQIYGMVRRFTAGFSPEMAVQVEGQTLTYFTPHSLFAVVPPFGLVFAYRTRLEP